MTQQVKRAFKYRLTPTNEQAAELSRPFGCVRLVYNKALSTGEKVANPKHERRDRSRLARAQRELSRKVRGSANREKARYGRELVVIDRWFPGSKLCGACGTVAAKMPLNVREWTCECGTVHDRDVNAARNILAAGLAVSACGDGVRPQWESSRTGRSSVKQEAQRVTAGIPRL